MEELELVKALTLLTERIEGFSRRLDSQNGKVERIAENVNQQTTLIAVQTERLATHQLSDDQNQKEIMEKIEEKHDSLKEEIVKTQINSADNRTKLEELLTWKGKVLGGLAIIGALLGLFGHQISEAAGKLLGFLGAGH